jgi:hypothetical protein
MGTASMAALTGAAMLGYILWAVPPLFTDGQPNTAALILFIFGLLMLVFGVGSLVSLALHRRWPMLAGSRDRRRRPAPWIALRQGALLALAVGVMLLLALLRMFDLAFALVTLVLAGLVEGFLQSRQR